MSANNTMLEELRHSAAHLLAAAVLKLWPEAKLAIGPPIADGFYYDVDFGSEKINEENLRAIEKTMRELLPEWTNFQRGEVSPKEAAKRFAKNPYKRELIDELRKTGETITLYTSGEFTDLCRGGHVENPAKDIKADAFKLTHVAGAYWRGDEKNPMLTRIYGTVFPTKEELDTHLAMLEEAKRRDHRKLGRDLELFTFDDDVGPGLPLWLPNGTVIIEELEKLAIETERKAGYARVRTPHIAKESLYKTSGHLPYYQESMYPPMEYEGGKYYLRAMNCPHHHKIFAARPRSYRELPLRMAEYGTVYRHEKSGELFGLMRVRMLQMNDAHIYCSKAQFADEFRAVNDLYLAYFKIFGIERYIMRFSTHDPGGLGKKYVGEPKLWKETEDMVRNVLVESKIPFEEVSDEAAFYGPKIDVQIWSAIGREFTLATNQVDFAQPRRFGLRFRTADGKEETPIVIHRAPLGTHERFIGFLIEHYAGAFPVWLAPMQVHILPIAERHEEKAKEILLGLRNADVRAELVESGETLNKRVRESELMKIPYIVAVGDRETKDALAIRQRGVKDQRTLSLDQLITEIHSSHPGLLPSRKTLGGETS